MIKQQLRKVWVSVSFSILLIVSMSSSGVLLGSAYPWSKMQVSPLEVLAQNPTPGENDSQTSIQPTPQASQEAAFPVTLDGETLFAVPGARGISAEERANQITERIETIAQDFDASVNYLQILPLNNAQALYAQLDNGAVNIILLQESDAIFLGRSLDEMAEEYLVIIKDAIFQYRQLRSVRSRSLSILYAGISTLVLFIFLIAQSKIFPAIYARIQDFGNTRLRAFRLQNFELISPRQATNFLIGFTKLVRWVSVVVSIYLYIVWVLGFFPSTRRWADEEAKIIFADLTNIWLSIVGYIDELFVIVITVFIAYYSIRLLKRFFDSIEADRISLPGFYREWAQPTYKLITLAIIALAFAIIFPYLPGSDSPSFRGVSIFIGALFTLGSAGAISNLVGGFILIYTRAFEIGDRIQIGDIVGDVIEKTILSTRIQTANNEIVTIPNSGIIGSNVKNYSATLRDLEQPLILQTMVTLGYDIPWRKVYEVLIEAAQNTPDILQDPAPFVWPVSLGDFYVSYQLKVYTNHPSKSGWINARLHQEIMDKCNQAGIEIMSSHYTSIRDGNQTTVPEKYWPENYTSPGFRLESYTNQSEHEN